ncbi:MATE family efflux transporter [Capnocytophaga canimorsus]|uniref:MATE family efflux transporter n=1 Tax=Capnocytophaga canimorsus TaxID=28188 RepID=UPI0037CDB177
MLFYHNISNYTREFKHNFKLAFPVILGMLGHTFVGFVDNVMVGKLGTAELAAVALGNSIVFVAMSFGIGFSTAFTPLVAEADSVKNHSEVKSILKHSILISSVLALFLFGLLFLSGPLMHWLKQPQEVVALAVPYTNLVAFSLIPLVFFSSLKQFTDGLSLTRYPMYVTLVGNLVNILLNYIFIYGNFGFPALGIIGAGIGTLVSRLMMPILLWFILLRLKKTKDLIRNLNWKNIERFKIRKIINLGVPSGMQMVFEVGIFTAAIWISGVLGKNPQAANQVALNLSSMTFMVASGLSVAAMIRVGNQRGLRDFANLRRIALSVFLLVFFTQTCFASFFALFRHWLPTLYLDMNDIVNQSDNLEVISEAAKLLLIAAIFQISDGLQVAALGALRGLQDVKKPMYITFVAYWVISFPISYILGLHTPLGGMGIWIGLLLGLTIAAIWLLWRFHKITLKMINN